MVRVEKRRRKKRRSKNKEEYENDLRTRERAQVVFFEGRGWGVTKMGAIGVLVRNVCLSVLFGVYFQKSDGALTIFENIATSWCGQRT